MGAAEARRASEGHGSVSADELVPWLRAEIEADKRAASAKVIRLRWTADPEPWEAGATGIVDEHGGSVAAVIGDYAARHILRQQPLDTIARCEAELAVLDEYTAARELARLYGPGTEPWGHAEAWLKAVRVVGCGYRYRPGYREAEWKP